MPDGPQPAMPQPGPVPSAFTVAQAQQADGNIAIVLSVATPVGTAVYFLPPEVAKQLGGNLVRLGGAGRVILASAVNGTGRASKP